MKLNQSLGPLALLLAGLLVGCNHETGDLPQTSTDSTSLSTARQLVGPGWPVSAEQRLTTDGSIYVANLDSQVNALSKIHLLRGDGLTASQLAMALYHRFQVTGRLSDAELALQTLQSTRDAHASIPLELTLYKVAKGFHKFHLAQHALAQARLLGAKEEHITRLQGSLDVALGRSGQGQFPASGTSGEDLVVEAARLFEQGNSLGASLKLKQAQDEYTDTSPYVLAWIHVQQGIMFLRHEDYRTARIFFRAAHERLPQYALATEHLAETELVLGNAEQAMRLYEQVVEQTAHPEFHYQLAAALDSIGRHRDAAAHLQHARQGYARLTGRHPQMYSDHAAHYYLETGDLERAYALASQNLALRQDHSARTLMAEVLVAMKQAAAACVQVHNLKTEGYAPPEIERMAGLDCRQQGSS